MKAERRATVSWKVLGCVLVFALGGPTVTDLTTFLVVSICLFAVLFSPISPPMGARLGAFVAIVVVVGASKTWFATPPIAEGQGVFVPDSTSAYQDALPPAVYSHLAQSFAEDFSRTRECAPPVKSCWLDRRADAPPRGFAFGSESLLFSTALTRQVWETDFDARERLPLFALNDLRYNFFPPTNSQTWIRKELPFFVAYSVPEHERPVRLCWRGHTFWPQSDGSYQKRFHETRTCETLMSGDPTGPVFGVETRHSSLAMALEPSASMHLRRALGVWLGYAGAFAVVLLLLGLPQNRLPWRDLVLPIGAIAATLGWGLFLEPLTATGVRIHPGGSDGLGYESFARTMAEAAANGDWFEALRGVESVFWSMPGLRYFLAIVKPIFGDTLFGYLLACAFLPIAVHRLSGVFLSARAAAILTALFLLTPVFEYFRFTQFIYVKLVVEKSLAEPMGYLLLIAAIIPAVSALADEQPRVRPRMAFLIGFMCFVAVAMRPNLAPTAGILLAVLGIWFLRTVDWPKLALLCLGFAPIGLLGLHNYVYGGEFHLLTMTGDHPANLEMPPSVWLQALAQLWSGDFAGTAFQRMLKQLHTWNSPDEFYRIVVFLVVVWVAFAKRTQSALRLLAWLALSQQATLFFFHASGRYAFLAWALTFLVFVIVTVNEFWPWWRLKTRRPASTTSRPGETSGQTSGQT